MNHFSRRNPILKVPKAPRHQKCIFSQNRSSWTSKVVLETPAKLKIMPVRVPPSVPGNILMISGYAEMTSNGSLTDYVNKKAAIFKKGGLPSRGGARADYQIAGRMAQLYIDTSGYLSNMDR